jgi:hypothetical protein
MFQIVEGRGRNAKTESTLATRQALENRLKMLRRNNPDKFYWEDRPVVVRANSSKVSVTQIP